MQQVQLSDQLYQEIQRRAAEVGYVNVDEYVADVLKHDLEDPENLGLLFSQERLAHIDRAAAQIDAGQGLTLAEVDAELARKKAEWLRQNSR